MKLRVNCVGKLPVFSDFIEPTHRTGFRSELRDWLMTSSGGPLKTFEGTWTSRRSYLVVWPVAAQKHLLVAVIWPSGDAVGRWFPFCVYTQIPRRKLALRAVPELPLSVVPLWQMLQETVIDPNGRSWFERDGDLTPREVQQVLKSKRLRFSRADGLTTQFEQDLDSRSAVDLLEKLFGEAFWAIYPRLVWELIPIAERLSREDNPQLCIRVPASEYLNASTQATLWLRLLQNLARHPLKKLPTLFIPVGDASHSGIWIVYRDPIPQDVPVLFGNAEAHDYLFDLRRPELPEEAEGFQRFTSLIQDALKPELSGLGLADLPLREYRSTAELHTG